MAASQVRSRAQRQGASIPASAALRPLALIGIAFGALTTIADPDLWGHLRFGLDIIATGRIGAPDPYSFTADREWINHEWLSEVTAAAMFRVGGPLGLMALKAALAVASPILTWFVLRRTHFTWRWIGVGFVAWATLALAFTLRPQLWTAIALAALGSILTHGSRRTLWLLPPLFALWTNLHGGWIVGGGILALWTGVAWLQHSALRWPLLGVGAASLLCTLLNPHGLDLWRFLLETVRLSRADVSEWSPIWKAGIGFSVMWSLSVALIAASWRQHGRPPLSSLITLVLFAFAAARVNRLVPLFAVATVTLLASTWPGSANATTPAGDRARALFEGICVAAFVVVGLWSGTIPRCISIDHDSAPDTIAAETLRGAHGRLVTHFDWGEYALWHFGPQLKVSIDGRRETVYSTRVLEEQLAIASGSPAGLTALDRLRPEYVWLPVQSSATAKWLRERGYREAVRTNRSFVAVRGDLPPLSPFRGTTSGCFPGP